LIKLEKSFAISLLKNQKTEDKVPTCNATSKLSGILTFMNCWMITKWPELEIGSHSVNPCTNPRKTAFQTLLVKEKEEKTRRKVEKNVVAPIAILVRQSIFFIKIISSLKRF